jgi:hypothetical protein
MRGPQAALHQHQIGAQQRALAALRAMERAERSAMRGEGEGRGERESPPVELSHR